MVRHITISCLRHIGALYEFMNEQEHVIYSSKLLKNIERLQRSSEYMT
jgi:hypothetical protein